jgi:hypothetical protein
MMLRRALNDVEARPRQLRDFSITRRGVSDAAKPLNIQKKLPTIVRTSEYIHGREIFAALHLCRHAGPHHAAAVMTLQGFMHAHRTIMHMS